MHVCMPTYCNVRCSWKTIRDLNRTVVEHDSRWVTASDVHNNNMIIILINIIKTFNVSYLYII